MPTAPTRKSPTTPSVPSLGARKAPANEVIRTASFTAESRTLTLDNTVGIGVGMFASTEFDGVAAGSIVTAVSTTTVTIDRDTIDGDTNDVTFSRIPPAPTRKSS